MWQVKNQKFQLSLHSYTTKIKRNNIIEVYSDWEKSKDFPLLSSQKNYSDFILLLNKNFMIILTKAIITAMSDEAEMIIEKYSLQETKKLWALTIYEWDIKNQDNESEHLVLLLCGVWKIHAAFATTYLFENFDPFKIINIGVVGNLQPSTIKIWDVVLPNTFLQHDVYIPESIDSLKYLRDPIFIEYAIGEEYNLEKFSLHLHGICVTGDQFIDNEDLKNELVEEHNADIVDMEAYAILSVAKNYDALDKMVVIKSVSDGADNEAADAHVGNLEAAMKNAVIILELIL